MTCERPKPIITVITVVYNAADTIESTIASVLGQHYDNLRFIIIDGGSTDGTVRIIRKYEEQISCWVSEKDSGIYDAMNKGWALADIDSFILFLGAGDRLISLPFHMENYSANDVVFGKVQLSDKFTFNPSSGIRLRLYNSIHHQALLVNKTLHPEPPFNYDFKIYADFDLNQRLYKRRANFIFDETFNSVALPGGVSDKTDITESFRVIRKNFGVFWGILAVAGFVLIKACPPLKRLRPISKTGN